MVELPKMVGLPDLTDEQIAEIANQVMAADTDFDPYPGDAKGSIGSASGVEGE